MLREDEVEAAVVDTQEERERKRERETNEINIILFHKHKKRIFFSSLFYHNDSRDKKLFFSGFLCAFKQKTDPSGKC
jgi:hypothetical protein